MQVNAFESQLLFFFFFFMFLYISIRTMDPLVSVADTPRPAPCLSSPGTQGLRHFVCQLPKQRQCRVMFNNKNQVGRLSVGLVSLGFPEDANSTQVPWLIVSAGRERGQLAPHLLLLLLIWFTFLSLPRLQPLLISFCAQYLSLHYTQKNRL